MVIRTSELFGNDDSGYTPSDRGYCISHTLEYAYSDWYIARNNSPENGYIQSISLNGEPYNKNYLYHSDIVDGSILTLEMGEEPK